MYKRESSYGPEVAQPIQSRASRRLNRRHSHSFFLLQIVAEFIRGGY